MQLINMDLDRRVALYRTLRNLSPQAWESFHQKINLSLLFHDYAMDGVALTECDMSRALSNAPPRHHCDGEMLEGIRNTLEGIHLARQFAEERGAPGLEEIKRFHAILLPVDSQQAGRYRKTEGPMMPYCHEITRTPSISYRLRKLVDAIPEMLAQLHPIMAAALIHHEFMSIWPFDHRSATAGRLLLNGCLMRGGYPPAIIHATDRQTYYAALCDRPEAMIPVVVEALELTLQGADAFFSRRAERVA